jgi:hypothetical protein
MYKDGILLTLTAQLPLEDKLPQKTTQCSWVKQRALNSSAQ